MIACKELFE